MTTIDDGRRQTLEAAVVDAVTSLPGVHRLVPSYRELLKPLRRNSGEVEDRKVSLDGRAHRVDILERGGEIIVHLDVIVSTGAVISEVVDDLDAAVRATMTKDVPERSLDVRIRILGEE